MALFPFLSKTTRYEKAAEQYRPQVARVNELSDEMHALSDGALKERVSRFAGQPLSEVNKHQVEIFAAVREAGARILELRHFDVQLLGGFALLAGSIAEMKTGEGKTLVATLPLILRGITGQGAHLVTVNGYLAKRDAAWMSPL